MTHIVADIGSAHGGSVERCKEAIKLCKDVGVSVVKFQMFYGDEYTKVGNIELPRDYWHYLMDYAETMEMPITASAFDYSAIDLLNRSNVPFIKFSYGNRFRTDWFEQAKHPLMVSCDDLSLSKMPADAIKLLCISQYPVPYEVNFDGCFPKFDGFSDHTRGIKQTIRAAQSGAQWIEKHLKLDTEIGCPDEAFAISAKEMDQLVRSVS